jgi:predicted O-methyltransferase YrrM
MTSDELFNLVLSDWPKIHSGETETSKSISAADTILRGSALESVQENVAASACHGIEHDVARFLYRTATAAMKTLEIGSGISTLVFAIRGSQHVAVTPNKSEPQAIRAYAQTRAIATDRITFVCESSDQYLPACNLQELDLVFIDGKHAFPWPIIDWFYTADRLKRGGIMLLDDVQMASVSMLTDLLVEDVARWSVVERPGSRAIAFRKLVDSVHDVAWHMQPFITNRMARPQSFTTRVLRKLHLG